MKIIKYPDNSSYIDVSSVNPTEPIVFRINSYEDLWHLNQFVDAYNHSFEEIPTIIIPNLIDAQADRRFGVNQSSGLKLVGKFLNGMNAKFQIFHPHNQELVEGLIDGVKIIDNSEFIHEVLCKITSQPEYDYDSNETESNLILMSSDAGGFKPLMKLCDVIEWGGETFSAAKARSWDEKDGTKFVQQIHRDDFGGKDILIVDDICVYGGTFKGLSKMLREKNCGKLYLALSHMTVQDLGEDPVIRYFDKVFTTNSKFNDYYIEAVKLKDRQINNLEIIKLF